MTNPVVFKNTLPVGLLSLTQAVALPILAAGLLVLNRWYFGQPFDAPFMVLLMLVLVLGAVVLQPQGGLMTRLIGGRRKLITRVAWRWMILLFLLLAIGYATKSSGEISRRMLLSWAVV